MKWYEKTSRRRIAISFFGMKRSFDFMGRICFKLDDHSEQILRQESKNSGISLSDFIRNKLFSPPVFSQQNNSYHSENFQQLTAEIIELRKELRIVTGALVNIMQANGLSIDEMKKAGKEFFKERD